MFIKCGIHALREKIVQITVSTKKHTAAKNQQAAVVQKNWVAGCNHWLQQRANYTQDRGKFQPQASVVYWPKAAVSSAPTFSPTFSLWRLAEKMPRQAVL
ncbi:MAG: hypothetical protein WAX67_11525 [Rugosibacter sp.]